MTSAPTRGFVAFHLVGASLCWATAFIWMKLLSGRVEPAVVAASRAVIATLAIGAFFTLTRQALTPGAGAWRSWLVIGTFNGVVPNVLTAVAVDRIPAGLAAMIQASGPLIVATLAHVLFTSERLTWRRAMGVLVGFVGMLVLIGPAALPGSAIDILGILAMAATTLSYAGTTLYIRSLGTSADPNRLAFGQQLVAGIFGSAFALVTVGAAGTSAQVADNLTLLVVLGVLATAIPITLWMRLARAAGPAIASLNGYLLPVWATALAMLVLGERFVLREFIGAAIVLAGVYLATRRG